MARASLPEPGGRKHAGDEIPTHPGRRKHPHPTSIPNPLTRVGFWRDLMPGHGTFMVRVGAGAVWGRVGTLASPCVPTRHTACTRAPTIQGDASVPTPRSTTPAPTRRRPL